MTEFTVVIEETIVGEFKVIADDVEAALKIAESEYKKGAFVLTPGETQFKQMTIVNPSDKLCEWFEF